MSAGKVLAVDGVAAGQGRRAADAVLQLAHVAWEVAFSEEIERLVGDVQAAAVLAIETVEKGAGQQRDVARPLAQRRQEHRHDVDAIIEVGTEVAPSHCGLEVAIGGADETEIHLQRPCAADTFELAFLKDTQQLRLEGRRDLADLVEQQRNRRWRARSGRASAQWHQ